VILLDSGIYKLTHKENGKIYIGQSKHLKRRLSEHKRCEKSDDKKGSQSVVRRAIKKYGFDAFHFEIILYCEEGKKRISKANSGRIVSEETRKKLSESGKKTYLNNPRGEEWNKKLSIALTGKTKSVEHKQKISKARKEFIKNNPNSIKKMLGKKHSIKTKEIMSQNHLGILHTEESKLKLSNIAKNRKRVYLEDGSWKWSK